MTAPLIVLPGGFDSESPQNRARNGADGETALIAEMGWWRRPRGRPLEILLEALQATGITIRGRSFDAISMPSRDFYDFLAGVGPQPIDWFSRASVEEALPEMEFIEIKTSTQRRVRPDFSGFLFAVTASELDAAKALGPRYRVALYNKRTHEHLLLSVDDILARARSKSWLVTVQL